MITNKIAVFGKPNNTLSILSSHGIDTYSTFDISLSIIKNDVQFDLLGTDKKISDYDAIDFRSLIFTEQLGQAMYYLLRDTIYFFDEKRMNIPVSNKLCATAICAHRGIVVPNTLYISGSRLRKQTVLIDSIFEQLGDTVVMKDIFSHRGQANFLVKTKAQVIDILRRYTKSSFMFQEFIPNDSDLRVLVLHNKPESCQVRTRQDKTEHRNNMSTGAFGNMIVVDYMADYAILAQKITRILGQEIAGVDLLQSTKTGKWYFLESNYSPQIEDDGLEMEAFLRYYIS